MDIKQEATKRLNSLYNFVLDHKIFDHVTTLVLGKTTKELKAERTQIELQASNELLLDTLVSEYEDKTHQNIARLLLRNELEFLSVNQTKEVRQSSLMAVAANVVRQLMVFDGIISIQPLSQPVGLIYYMNFSYVDEDVYPEIVAVDKPESDQPSELLKSPTKTMKLEVLTSPVHAEPNKLQAGLTIEAIQNLQHSHDIDIEAEISGALANEMADEIANDILADLVVLAKQNQASVTIPIEFGNRHDIIIHINRASAYIANYTKRGCGNIIITDPIGVSLLQSNKQVRFIPIKHDKMSRPFSIGLVGYLTTDPNGSSENAQYRVYSSLSPTLYGHDTGEVKFLIGYRGKHSTDVGYIYAPYVPVMTTSVVVNPVTFAPHIHTMTRAGKWTKWFKKEDELTTIEVSSAHKSSAYYALLTVQLDLNNTKEENS